MKIHIKDDGFDYEANKSMVLEEMREEYAELRETSPEEIRKMIREDVRWENVFLDKFLGRIVEYDPEAYLAEE